MNPTPQHERATWPSRRSFVGSWMAKKPVAYGDPVPARYPVVLFDLDHTLFDFELSKKLSLIELFGSIGRSDVDELKALLTSIEAPLWRGLEAGELGLDTLNELRWKGVVESAGLDADSSDLAARYLDGLGRNGGLLGGARELLDALHGHCRMGLITNGYGEVQRPRLEQFDLARYFEAVVISAEIDVAKPDAAFFDVAMAEMAQPAPADVLVVGDSLTSDMAGGVGYGLPTCWYNPHGKDVPAEMGLDHVATELSQVAEIVLGE